MKRIILASCYIITCVAMVSCTSDEVETTPNKQQQVSAYNSGDGQSGQTPTTPPKP
ncbi:MAG: hypothetical protein RL619_922 [Bacteroidota bacterium]|jgi:hypothetical protein